LAIASFLAGASQFGKKHYISGMGGLRTLEDFWRNSYY
jgi:hypothetical protein